MSNDPRAVETPRRVLEGNWRVRAYVRTSPAGSAQPEASRKPTAGYKQMEEALEMMSDLSNALAGGNSAVQQDGVSRGFPQMEDPQIRHHEEPKDEEGEYDQEVLEIIERAMTLFVCKNAEYGNSIVRTGVMGSVVAMTGDIARLRAMVLRSQGRVLDLSNTRDKLLDILVQAAIGILMLDRGNIVGED